jgi:hypothetical protein
VAGVAWSFGAPAADLLPAAGGMSGTSGAGSVAGSRPGAVTASAESSSAAPPTTAQRRRLPSRYRRRCTGRCRIPITALPGG